MLRRLLAAAALLGAAPFAMADCEFTVEVGDGLQYSVTEMTAEKSCGTVKVTITHTGTLPAQGMGHNWVLSAASDVDSIAMDGISAGFDNNYLPPGDERILASTKLVGGGESATVEFSVADLAGDLMFFCSFPGHTALMKGTFKLV
ncbi:MAG: azurin [Pseudomonadota bacterium]